MAAYERDYETELRVETSKWAARLSLALAGAAVVEKDGERFLENIRAYQDDSEHFRDAGDLVRAFECVVWAWAWLEIGEDMGILRVPALRQE